jgi:hyperosmotically inducible protein
MNVQETFTFLGLSLLLTVGTGCDKPRTAETTGQRIDRAADETGKKMGDAADRVADKLGEEGKKVGVAIDDTEITTKVKAAILAEHGLNTLQISVDTVHGVVTLTGSVDSRASSHRANGLAGAVAGVKKVENRLVVKSAR